MAVRFWRSLYDRLKSDTAGFVGKVGLFAVLVTVVSAIQTLTLARGGGG